MSSREFLNEVYEIGNEYGEQGESASFITKISIDFGFWAYPGEGQDRLKYWKRCESKKEAKVVKAEVQARLDEAGVLDFRGNPAKADYCMRVWASGDWLGREPKDFDDNQFYARWQWDKKDDLETCVSLILDSVEKNQLPLGKEFWGRYILKSNPYHVNQGEKGKKKGKDGKMYWPNFILPVEMFKDESAAKATVSSSGSDSGSVEMSDMAKALYPDAKTFLAQAEGVHQWYNEALKGKELPGKPIKEYLSPNGSIAEDAAKLYIADVWGFEVNDVNTLLDEVPF